MAQQLAEKHVATKGQDDAKMKARSVNFDDDLLPVPRKAAAVGTAAAAGGKTGSAEAAVAAGVEARAKQAPVKNMAQPPGLRRSDTQQSIRPKEAPKWQCGSSRLDLRAEFNKHEIDIASIMRKYDWNNDGSLEPPEFKKLLSDQKRWSQKASDEEVACIMALADSDEDGNISPLEVFYALKVWYAYIKMDRSAGRIIASLGNAHIPSDDVLQSAMMHMNDDYHVELDEVRHVKETLLLLGATHDSVPTTRLRMAISSWYLNVERTETPQAHLIKLAFDNANEKVTSHLNPTQKLMRGHCDQPTAVGSLFMLVTLVLHPCTEIFVATHWPENPRFCLHSLSTTLSVSGVSSLLWFVMLVWVTSALECERCSKIVLCKQVSGVFLGVMTLFVAIVFIIGASVTANSASRDCGIILVLECQITYFLYPFFVVVFLFIGMPCLYLCELQHYKQLESNLNA